MNDHAGYQWAIEEQPGGWAWAIRSRDEDQPLVDGLAASRAQAAACVVRALILGVTVDQPRSMAAA